MTRHRHVALLLGCAALMAGVVGCGGSSNKSSSSSSGGGSSSSGGGTVSGAKVIDLNTENGAKGNVTYCTGKDTSGDLIAGIKDFNTKNPGIKAKLLEFPEEADAQRAQFIQRERAKSADCDLFESDVIWTAEFASQKWLYDMTPYIDKRKSEFIPSTLDSVHYGGKYWGIPRVTDAGLLYYNTDQTKSVPATWQAVYNDAKSKKGIIYQGKAYEGLTVNYLELAFAAGGKVLSADGKKSEINSPQNLKALQFMADGIKSGAAPKAVTTYAEEEARRVFEAGRATYERQWPYAYALGNMKGSKVKGKFKVAPYPAFEGGGKAAILGGHNMVVSAYSKNPGAALKLIDYFSSPEVMKRAAIKYSKAPILSVTYDDPAVQKALPFANQLKQSVEQAKSRPVSPVYTQISQAIYKNVNEVLSGATDPQSALKKADDQINSALATF